MHADFPLYILFSPFLEPVGSVRPKVNVNDKLNTKEVGAGETFAILCPGQSYPIPVFR